VTRAAKITYSCALLIGFLTGLIFGFRYAMELLPDYEVGIQMAAAHSVDDFGRTQFFYATPEDAEKSLGLCETLLQQLQRWNPGLPEQMSLADTYVRLAILADHRGNTEQSRAYMAKAQQWHDSLLLAKPASDAQLKAGLMLRDSIWGP
jgi:hypothetical protein